MKNDEQKAIFAGAKVNDVLVFNPNTAWGIFDKFYQVDGSHKAEGNDLGLALVKRIVDSAGGTIKAENREYGGCRFVVELPICLLYTSKCKLFSFDDVNLMFTK